MTPRLEVEKGQVEKGQASEEAKGSINLTLEPYSNIYSSMKTTIDLPESLLERSKIEAAKRRTTLKNLVIEGLEVVLAAGCSEEGGTEARERLRRGFRLGGKPLSREEAHAR